MLYHMIHNDWQSQDPGKTHDSSTPIKRSVEGSNEGRKTSFQIPCVAKPPLSQPASLYYERKRRGDGLSQNGKSQNVFCQNRGCHGMERKMSVRKMSERIKSERNWS